MELILAWQNTVTRRWSPVARISREGNEYVLRYVHGVMSPQAGAAATLPGMENVHVEYRSRTLFPFFQNRLYNRKRADWDRYRSWLGLTSEDMNDPMVELAASGGIRATDPYQLLRVPERCDGQYSTQFFVHGSRYAYPLPDADNEDEQAVMQRGDRLLLQFDIQNPVDPSAISLRTDTQKRIVGFLPRLIDRDVQRLVEENGPETVRVTLNEISEDAPHNLRYRCTLSAPWPADFVPFSDPEYLPIDTTDAVAFVA